MAQPWKTLATHTTADGVLELRQRGPGDFLITLGGLVLMNSLASRSEVVLGQIGCRKLKNKPRARVLVGGLGMGMTLRAVLDTLSEDAEVVVVELNPVVADWCRGPLATLTAGALTDPRVRLEVGDVADRITDWSQRGIGFDAVLFDLYRGPHANTDPRHDPLYGSRAIARVDRLLPPGGRFAVWGESDDAGFAERLQQAGFATSRQRPGRGGYRHLVFIADKPGPVRPD